MAAIAAAADPPVAFRNFDHLVLVEPNTGCCLRSPSDIGICGGGYKKSRKRHTPIPMALSRIDADDFSISTVVVAHELGPNFWLVMHIELTAEVILLRSTILVNTGIILAVMVRFLLSKK